MGSNKEEMSSELKLEADQLIADACLPELLTAYEEWFIGGSYSYDLMCWRDLDIYFLDRTRDLKSCFTVGYELTRRLGARKSRFTNNVGQFEPGPDRLYWGIKLGDSRHGEWKLDFWFLDEACYGEHARYSASMREQLSAETRSAILTIKESYWRRSEYRDTITSHIIYHAVLDEGVRTVSHFERLIRLTEPLLS